jgi:hypothetical protein
MDLEEIHQGMELLKRRPVSSGPGRTGSGHGLVPAMRTRPLDGAGLAVGTV